MLANYTGNYFIRRIVCIILIAAPSGCVKRTVEELTSTSPYANIIDAEYRIIAEVKAYGIYESLDRKVVSYITLIPGSGIAGPEVAFERRVKKGQKIKILSVWREHKLLNDDVYYVVTFQDTDLPRDVQVRIELSRGNEGVDAELNPGVYERLAK